MHVCAHTPVTLCTIEGIRKEIKEERKLYCSSQDVAESGLFFSNCEYVACGKGSLVLSFSSCLLSAAGTHQLYLHPPFPTVLKKINQFKV